MEGKKKSFSDRLLIYMGSRESVQHQPPTANLHKWLSSKWKVKFKEGDGVKGPTEALFTGCGIKGLW